MDKGGAKAERGYPGPIRGKKGGHFERKFQGKGVVHQRLLASEN